MSTRPSALGVVSLLISSLLFGGVCWDAWNGVLGARTIVLLIFSTGTFFFGKRRVSSRARVWITTFAKVAFTSAGMMALLRHPIPIADEESLPIYNAILIYIQQVDRDTFLFYAALAMAVKFIGVLASAFAWHLLLVGQGIRYPYWSKVVTAFLIGRFIGTFLPSTVGLDGYTLYEAGRYSNQWKRVITAKFLEKFIGITGLFLGMILTLPFGFEVITDVTSELGRPDSAPTFAAAIIAVAGGVSTVVVCGLIWPGMLIRALGILGTILPNAVRHHVEQFAQAVSAYKGKVGLLLIALFSKFITHFTTATVYFFTALAIGVVSAQFWPIVFGSSIQILATLLSPTIAGEGAREAFQALLLSNQLGGVAQAVLSGALGFLAAEAATIWGGVFLWTRSQDWRPAYAIIDGQQVDYDWITAADTGMYSADRMTEIKRRHKP